MNMLIASLWYLGNIYPRFSSNSEAATSELLVNLEEMFRSSKGVTNTFEVKTRPFKGNVLNMFFGMYSVQFYI